MRRKSPCPLPVAIFAVRRMDVRFEQRASTCADLLHEALNDATFVNSIIAEDESWCLQYDTAKKTATWEYRGYSSGKTMELTGIPKEAFNSCFQDLQKHWQQFIDCGGNELCQVCLSVCPSVRSHGTFRLPLTGFSWNLIFEYFSRKFKFLPNQIRITGALHEDRCIFMIIYRRILLIMRNISDKMHKIAVV
jgi:hypothetical protein